jgi:hypothetical protein
MIPNAFFPETLSMRCAADLPALGSWIGVMTSIKSRQQVIAYHSIPDLITSQRTLARQIAHHSREGVMQKNAKSRATVLRVRQRHG